MSLIAMVQTSSFSIFSSASRPVQWSERKIAVFKKGEKMNISVKLFGSLASGLEGDVI